MPGSPLEASVRVLLHGTHWLVVDGPSVGAEAIATELRHVGCLVRLVDPEGRHVPQLGTFDAHVVLVDEACDMRFLAERMAMSPGLRWASVLRMDWSELWTPDHEMPAVGVLAARAAPLLQPDIRLRHQARTLTSPIYPDVADLGPVRTLRAIATNDDVFRVSFSAEFQQARIELAGNLVLSAMFRVQDGPVVTGDEAFASALDMVGATVSLERRSRPETLSLVAPIDEALMRALETIRVRREAEEAPTVRFSSPGPSDLRAEDANPPEVSGLRQPERHPPPTQLAPSLRAPRFRIDDTRVWLERQRARLADGSKARKVALSALGVLTSVMVVLWVWLLAMPSDGPATVSAAASPSPVASQPSGSPMAPKPAAPERPSLRKTSERAAAKAARREAANEARRAAPAAGQAADDAADDDPHALERLSRRALKEGDTSSAVTYAARAVLLRKKRVAYRLLYGDALAADGQKERALEQYRIALDSEPDSKDIRSRIARLGLGPSS